MANIVGKTITNQDWEKAETVLGITFLEGVKYVLQARGGCYICVATDKPLKDEGFLINESSQFPVYTHEMGTTLWIKTNLESAVFNIGV